MDKQFDPTDWTPEKLATLSPRTRYSVYIRSDAWRLKRAEAIERAGGCCQLCSSKQPPLHVHHNNYKRLGDEAPTDLTVLCKRCHNLYHSQIDKRTAKTDLTVQARTTVSLPKGRSVTVRGLASAMNAECYRRVEGATGLDRKSINTKILWQDEEFCSMVASLCNFRLIAHEPWINPKGQKRRSRKKKRARNKTN